MEKTPTRKLLLSDGISFPEVHNEDGRFSAPSHGLHLWTRAGRRRWRARGAAGGDLGEYYNAIATALKQLQPHRCMSVNSQLFWPKVKPETCSMLSRIGDTLQIHYTVSPRLLMCIASLRFAGRKAECVRGSCICGTVCVNHVDLRGVCVFSYTRE